MIIGDLAFRMVRQRGVTKHQVKAVRRTARESNYLNINGAQYTISTAASADECVP